MISTIRSRLAYEHISQDELAKMIGMEGSTLSNKLTGRYQLKLDELFSIAAALHCDAASLVAGKAPHDAGGVGHDAYTVDQVAQMIGRSRDDVLDLIHTGHLEAIQPVREYLITRRSYEKFVNEK